MQFIPLNLNASWQDKIGIPQRKRLRHDTNLIFSLPAADFPPPVFPFSGFAVYFCAPASVRIRTMSS